MFAKVVTRLALRTHRPRRRCWIHTNKTPAFAVAAAATEPGEPARRHASSTCAGAVSDGVGRLKSMDELGGPSFLSTLYWLFVKGYFQTTQQMQIEHKKLYGPLWKSTYGPLVVVNVASAELIEQVLRQEGRLPVRTDMPHWRHYREVRNQAHGPLTEMGANWQRIRSILNPRMLKPKHVASYADTINPVVADFVERLCWLRKNNNNSSSAAGLVHDMTGELYKFAFEGICSVLFERRLGCLEQDVPEATQKFIWSVGEMFRLSSIVILFPKRYWPYLPFWNKFVAAWDHLFKFSEELVQKKLEELGRKEQKDGDVEGAYLTHLLLSEKMNLTEILGSVTELLLAGVDTTSNTIAWALYHLAKEPGIQDQLHREVSAVCPASRGMPTAEVIARLPFLKAVVRETLRLYPVVPGNARVTVENEIVVGDHLFPKSFDPDLILIARLDQTKSPDMLNDMMKTLFHLCHYAVSHDDGVFPEPHRFLPQRWLRQENAKQHQHPFGSVPFGFGIRACLGRRVAELEMYLLLSTLITRFEVRPDPSSTGPVKPITRTLLCPATPINLIFTDRR